MLTIRLRHLYDEAQRILDWSEHTGSTIGMIPDTLDDYAWSCPELREFISYFDGDTIEFHPIRELGVQHGYRRGRGWYFNED